MTFSITITFLDATRTPLNFKADARNEARLKEELLGSDESRAGTRYAFKQDDGKYAIVDWDSVSSFEIKESYEGHPGKKIVS